MVIVVPTLNGWERIPTLLASVDIPARVVIVDNALSGKTLPGTEVIRPLMNLGFSGSINAAIAQTPDAEWWMWASDDIAFGAGDLTNIRHLIEDARSPRVVTGDRSDERLLRFAYAALNREAIEAVGLLDEWTFYPVYFEDDDYEYRCRQGGVEWVTYNGNISHQRSATIREPAAAAGNARTFPQNRERYVAKWGGPPGSETHSRPWGKPVPLSYAPVDIAGRARRIW